MADRVFARKRRWEHSRERGSVLLLMPTAVLIVVLLGGLSVDRAVLFGAQRDLVATAQQAANDAAGLGVDLDALRAAGQISYDEARIDQAVRAAMAEAAGAVTARWQLRDGRIEVVLDRRVDLIFSKGVPGAPDGRMVHARASAVLRRQ